MDAQICQDPQQLYQASHIVLPGVGAFEVAINNLKKGGWVEALNDNVLVQKKPLLGICLGLQLLANKSYENGVFEGLGYVPGEVRPLRELSFDLPVPNVGWAEVSFLNQRMFSQIQAGSCFYFVHSFYFKPTNPDNIAGTSFFGEKFCCSIVKDNIWATQFHPEKSQKAGLALFKNFAMWNGSST